MNKGIKLPGIRILAIALATILGISYLTFVSPQPASAAEKTYGGMTLSQVQQQILKETNSYRKSKGLPALKLHSSINTVAVKWSQTQAKKNKMYHNPNYASQIPKGWNAAGENVAMGYAPKSVTKAWWNSPGHKANILNKKFTHVGIGVANGPSGLYYTQVFGGYKTTPKVATTSKTAKKYTTTTALNLRKSATTNSSRILTIPKGASVGIVKAKSGKWFKVTYKGKTGWVHSSYLR